MVCRFGRMASHSETIEAHRPLEVPPSPRRSTVNAAIEDRKRANGYSDHAKSRSSRALPEPIEQLLPA